MISFLAFILGLAAALLAFWLAGISKRSESAFKWYMWVLVAVWYLWTVAGVSFVVVNVMGKHAKAATTGAFIFFIISIIAAVLLARFLGLFGSSKRPGGQYSS